MHAQGPVLGRDQRRLLRHLQQPRQLLLQVLPLSSDASVLCERGLGVEGVWEVAAEGAGLGTGFGSRQGRPGVSGAIGGAGLVARLPAAQPAASQAGVRRGSCRAPALGICGTL